MTCMKQSSMSLMKNAVSTAYLLIPGLYKELLNVFSLRVECWRNFAFPMNCCMIYFMKLANQNLPLTVVLLLSCFSLACCKHDPNFRVPDSRHS